MVITREELRGFLYTLKQAHLRVGVVTPVFTKVLAALDEAAEIDSNDLFFVGTPRRDRWACHVDWHNHGTQAAASACMRTNAPGEGR